MNKLVQSVGQHLRHSRPLYYAQEYLNTEPLHDWKNNISDSTYNKVTQNPFTYERNLIHSSSLFDIYIILWGKEAQSAIHGHPANGCLLKVLDGCLLEKNYTKSGPKRNRLLFKDDIGYIHDDLRFHAIHNISRDISTSLHIYSPGNLGFPSNKYPSK